MSKKYARVIHWFRRDLRLTDNSALHAASQTGAEVVTVYVVSDWKGRHAWTGAPRQAILGGCLESLAKNVAAAGGIVLDKGSEAEVELETFAGTDEEAEEDIGVQ